MPECCYGCGRELYLTQNKSTPLDKQEIALWRAGDGRVWGWCCWNLAAIQEKEKPR